MQLQVIAVGTKMPSWVTDGVQEYSKRMPPQASVRWHEIRAETRKKSDSVARCQQREAQRINSALPPQCFTVLLDETGSRCTTEALAKKFSQWQELGRPICLIIGGPDGVDASIKSQANQTIRLSDLTLPHPLVRVVLAEQLYRAWTILENHPYHRA